MFDRLADAFFNWMDAPGIDSAKSNARWILFFFLPIIAVGMTIFGLLIHYIPWIFLVAAVAGALYLIYWTVKPVKKEDDDY